MLCEVQDDNDDVNTGRLRCVVFVNRSAPPAYSSRHPLYHQNSRTSPIIDPSLDVIRLTGT